MAPGKWLGYTLFGFASDAVGRRKSYVAYLLVAAVLVPVFGSTRSLVWLSSRRPRLPSSCPTPGASTSSDGEVRMTTTGIPTVDGHFQGRAASVTATYAAVLTAARRFGRVREEPRKTSIHLVRETAFAGVATQKAALVLTIKSDRDVRSPRIRRHERASANRWHLEVRLTSPEEVDRELRGWLERAYSLAGGRPPRR